MTSIDNRTCEKRKTDAGSTLLHTPQSRNLMDYLRDLITLTYERSISRRSSSLALEALRYVYGENNGEKYCMHFVVQVRERGQQESVRLAVSFTVSKEDDE